MNEFFSYVQKLDYVSIIIQFTGSIALYYNKRHVRDQTPSGWLLAVFGLTVLSIPILQNKFYVTFVLHMGMIVLSLYGYAVAVKLLQKYSKRFDLTLRVSVVALTLGVSLYVTYYYKDANNFNGLQLTHALTGLFGSLLLALNTQQTRKFGWLLFGVSHFVCSMYMIPRGLYIIVFFQILSIQVAWSGFKKNAS